MARGRKRQKKRKIREEESIQVDLLADAHVPDGEETDAPESAAPAREPREGTDRWAKAVGQLKPTRPDQSVSPVARRPLEPPQAPPAETPAPHPEPRVSPPETQVSAWDHGAAGRPAGEPLARARELVEQGRVHEAMELYLGILTVNPSNLKARNNLGVLLDELKQFDAALVHFEAAAELAPENVEVLANFASTLTSLGRYDQAEEILRRAQRLSAEDAGARLGLGILHFRRGLYAQAETELGWVCERDEGNGQAFYYRGEALNRLGRYEEAAAALARAIELSPDDPRPYYTLGHLYDRRHDLQEAAEMYRRARRLQAP